MKPVLVTWFDAVSNDEWTEVSNARDEELATIRTLGWLVNEDERRIVVAPSWDIDNDNVASLKLFSLQASPTSARRRRS